MVFAHRIPKEIDADTERQQRGIGDLELLGHETDCWRKHTRRERRDNSQGTYQGQQAPFLTRSEVLWIGPVVLAFPAHDTFVEIHFREPSLGWDFRRVHFLFTGRLHGKDSKNEMLLLAEGLESRTRSEKSKRGQGE